MKITTSYNIGDEIKIGCTAKKILAVHLYISDNKHTERYYLGEREWLTLKVKNRGI